MKLPPVPAEPAKPARWRCRACKQDVDLKADKPCGCETSPSPWEIVCEKPHVSEIKIQVPVKHRIWSFKIGAVIWTKIDLKKPFKNRFLGVCFIWSTRLFGFWF